jgi:hypothetical protein
LINLLIRAAGTEKGTVLFYVVKHILSERRKTQDEKTQDKELSA